MDFFTGCVGIRPVEYARTFEAAHKLERVRERGNLAYQGVGAALDSDDACLRVNTCVFRTFGTHNTAVRVYIWYITNSVPARAVVCAPRAWVSDTWQSEDGAFAENKAGGEREREKGSSLISEGGRERQ